MALAEHVVGVPEGVVVRMGGDVKVDVDAEVPEAEVGEEMLRVSGLQRLQDDGETAYLLGIDLDVVASRGVLVGARCVVRTLDEIEVPMFDHNLLDCSLR